MAVEKAKRQSRGEALIEAGEICSGVIQAAVDKAVKAEKDAIARHFIKLFQGLLEEKG